MELGRIASNTEPISVKEALLQLACITAASAMRVPASHREVSALCGGTWPICTVCRHLHFQCTTERTMFCSTVLYMYWSLLILAFVNATHPYACQFHYQCRGQRYTFQKLTGSANDVHQLLTATRQDLHQDNNSSVLMSLKHYIMSSLKLVHRSCCFTEQTAQVDKQ